MCWSAQYYPRPENGVLVGSADNDRADVTGLLSGATVVNTDAQLDTVTIDTAAGATLTADIKVAMAGSNSQLLTRLT